MPTDNQGQVTITELDECELLPALCKGGTCQNTYGSFKCACPSGYVIDDTFICVGKLRASVIAMTSVHYAVRESVYTYC